MNASLVALEFERLKKLLNRYISSQDAAARLSLLAPSTDLAALEEEHTLVAEAMGYLRAQRVPFRDIPLLAPAIERLKVPGSSLEIPQIEAIQGFLNQVEGLRIRWREETESFPQLSRRAARMPDLRNLAKRLESAVHDGEVDERYSPKLSGIRKAMETARSRVTSRLEGLLRSTEYASQLQDQLITVRNGRFVIPVRADSKRGVDGIVHGTSSSGATVFMEPLVVLELNNELVRLREAEFEEVARILAELTDLIQESAPQLSAARALVSELEVLFAKARFGREFNCGRPVFSKGPLLSLVHARHPLLEDNLRKDGRSISAVSLDLDATRRILVISGPNAGGKTVVLKTAGLLCLMAQSGLPIPVEEATLPIFDQILADIGDQQSIANHLSTFSAHVLSMKGMLESATGQSLILLDEIGSSTEPGEGAALAKGVLESFRKIGCLVIATTHYNRLKVYAETTKDVANAAMEFNEQTLEPTYRLLHGLAGASSGLKIAERLQFPASALSEAVASLESGEADIALYVEELRRRIADLEREKAQLEEQRRDFESQQERELQELRTSHKKELDRAEKRVQQITQEMAERATKELEAIQDESLRKKYQRRLDHVRVDAVSQIQKERERVTPKAKPSGPPDVPDPRSIETGMNVRIESLGVVGSVVNVHEDEAEVLVGNIRLRRPLTDLRPAAVTSRDLPQGVQLKVTRTEPPPSEIHLLGCTVDEAISRVDKFLDEAYLAQISQVRIVHGFGTGALRNAIGDMLKSHPHVVRFEFASQNLGGRGVTIATLRD